VRRWISRVYPIGAVTLVFVAGVVHSRISDVPYRFGSQNSYTAYVGFGLLHLFVAAVSGVPDETDDTQPALLRSVLAGAIATALWLLIQTIFPGLLPRRVILWSAVSQPVWSFLCSMATIRSERRLVERERVVGLVHPDDVNGLESDCSREFPFPEQSFVLVDTVTTEEIDGLTHAADIHARLASTGPSLVVLSEAATSIPRVVDAVTVLHRSGVKVRTLAQFYEEYIGKESLGELTRMTMLFDVRTVHHSTYRRTKRVLDIAGASLGLVVAGGAIPFVLLGNLIGNRGPLFFSQARVGRDGQPFTITKFRTMRVGDDVSTTTWTSLDDPRITPFGRWLRRSHVDELPQLWCVLRGDLSLVGPRPEQVHYVEELVRKEPAFELRHLVTPGITGWAQVKHRYAATEAEAIEKLQYDLYYLRNQSLALDLRILSRTIRSVVRHRGR
jgi:lipopolysaccharide/colanic/teichoic acid biosynthesis glycosyltransferase